MTISNSISLRCWKETFHRFLSGCLNRRAHACDETQGTFMADASQPILWGVFLLFQHTAAAALFTLWDPSE